MTPHRETTGTDLEAPRHTIVCARISPMVELTRWLFERSSIPYHEEGHVPLVHVPFTLARRGGVEVPVVVSAEATWKGAREVLYGLDAGLRASERIFGGGRDDNGNRAADETLVAELLDRLLQTVRRYVYFHLLPDKKTLLPVATSAAPRWEVTLVRVLYPVWRRWMGRALDFSPQAIASAPVRIREAFGLVESELARRGTTYLAGAVPGPPDIIFAALAAPVVFPERYGSRLPALADLPTELRAFVDDMRTRRGGQLVLATYEAARTPPQAPLPRRSRRRPLSERLLTPAVQRTGARLAAWFGRVIVVRRVAIVSRWVDVQAVLSHDLDFTIAPINGPPINAINGPFVLGLDRGEQLASERSRMYEAVSRADLAGVRALIEIEAERLLDAAAERGRIDVGHGYARPVAARTAVRLFGIAGPTEAELTRVCRAMFRHAFLNVGSDAVVERRALRASELLRQWILDEITRRRASAEHIDDVLGHLMHARTADGTPLDDDTVRRNLAGNLVGAIDTTSVAVASIISVLAADRAMLARVERDLADRERMYGWCLEALRRRPQASLLLRRASHDVSIGGTIIPGGTTVAAFTQAAMFDRSAYPCPGHLDPARPSSRHLHFGGGLHPCAGRDINAVQLPELVGRLLARGITRVGSGRFDGPFLDELVVDLRRR